MHNIYKVIPAIKGGTTFAVATVIETSGSTPQKAGSTAVFDSSGLIEGTVGGGVLEGKVRQIAMESLNTKKSGIYHFDLDYDISYKQDAICGGNASVLVEIDIAPSSVFEKIKKSLEARIRGILVTIVEHNKQREINVARYWITSPDNTDLPENYSELLYRDFEKILSSSVPGEFVEKELSDSKESGETRVLLEPVFPSCKLIIAGAGHIGRALTHLGRLLDFEVTVIDDRAEYANRKNIPEADHLVVEDIGIALEKIDKQSDTYIVIVTRGHNDDAKALRCCINSDAAYIGMIGSRTKIGQMRQSFIENKWATEEQWSAVHAPIGLSINSKTVEEIAVSIAAQLIMVRNSRK